MFVRQRNLIGFRSSLAMACLALLAGCIPQPPPVQIAAAPANLQGTPGNNSVTLSWAASTDATGYNVSRATASGGPYVRVGSTTNTSYTDTGLTNGTAYFYVVSAVNAGGESVYSVQVTSTPVFSNPPPTTFGTWINVTPAGVDLSHELCSNYGASTIQVDPAHPSNLYTMFHCQGVWKSTDYGATWTGPINTGTNGATAGGCSGGIAIPPGSTASTPTIYLACIRGGAGPGLWKSTDGGVNWTLLTVPVSVRQDYYPTIDPYDGNHILLTGHEFDSLVESTDGGLTWSNITLPSGMLQNGRSAFVFFINTGTPSTTRSTWLWLAEQSGGTVGTWRTANGGNLWAKVESHEHLLGSSQMYQPGTDGVLYVAGAYSPLGWGVLRSSDYGQTWSHVGGTSPLSVVFGTNKNIYAMAGGPVGIGGILNPNLQVASQPGTGTWVTPGTPVGMTQGPAQVSVVNNGTNNILVGAMWNAGLWRYVEP